MGWASKAIESLSKGETVKIVPHGRSMSGKVESGQTCTVAPMDSASAMPGDIVLCKVGGREYLHLVTAKDGDRVQIGNNKGHVNGWTKAVYGKCVLVED